MSSHHHHSDEPDDSPDPITGLHHPDSGEEPVVLNEFANPDTERDDAISAGVIHADDLPAHVHEDWTVDVGLDVLGACGNKIGEVVDVRADLVVVEKGFFIPEDIFVPKSAISGVDEHHLTLSVAKDAIEHSGWDDDPDAIEGEMPDDPFRTGTRRVS